MGSKSGWTTFEATIPQHIWDAFDAAPHNGMAVLRAYDPRFEGHVMLWEPTES